MKKVMKTVATLMLMTAVVCIVGCKKTNNNGGGHYDGNYEYVDLGLPSGTLWATFNVGASVPEEYGDFFAWGETQPKADYKVNNYKYCNGDLKQLTKYCSDAEFGYNGFTDTLTSLQLMDDAASVNWGSDWCMPTAEQWRELIDYTTIADTINNCVYGVLVKASNGQCLFLPAAGNTSYPSYTEGVYCYYWSKTLHIGGLGPAMAWTFANKHPCVQGFGRAAGLPIRPVRSAKYPPSIIVENLISHPQRL